MDVLTSHAAFRVESRGVGSCQVIELVGELDLATAPLLKAAIDEIAGPDHIKFDLSQLDFIDSTGLRLLLDASELVEGRVWLKAPAPHVSEVFHLAGVAHCSYFADDRKTVHQLMSLKER